MKEPTKREEYIPFLKGYIENGVIPPLLYKYMPISEYLYKILINSELWFPSPASFNDPFNCQIVDQTDWNEEYAITFLKSTLENKVPNYIIEEEIVNYKKDPEGFKSNFTKASLTAQLQGGVACFAITPNNPLLWAHYSAKHTGVCLVFDIREDYEFFGLTIKVNYVNEYPKFDFNKDEELLPKAILASKSKIWEYEDEIRTVQSRFGNYAFMQECLKEIIFGLKSDPNEIKTIKLLVHDAQYPNVRLRQVILKKYEYAIDIIAI